MIKSMTAFAKASAQVGTLTADLTIRSYNSRYLDFAVHLPESCQPFEEDIKREIGRHHARGRMEVRVNLADTAEDQDLFEVDEIKARAYYKALSQVQSALGLSSDIPLDTVLGARQVITAAKREVDQDALKQVLVQAVGTAAKELDTMRRREGENLYQDLSARLADIEGRMETIEKLAASVPETYKARLNERLAALTEDADQIDPVRLAQEVAILADKSDVSEEIVRIHSHVKLFREIMDAEASQGRKLNFLIQEFNREFNTIGSKAGNPQLSHAVVDLKSELEKIREQVQNIE
ncbi:MAG: YicC family protein [Desulfobacter sp.]|nr:MAG: YicC family protein [Desulfobacter sp.]